MSLGSLIRNIKDRGLADITDMATIRSFFEWNHIKRNGIHLNPEDIVSYSEQLVMRRAKCPECVLAGECIHCHCDIDGKTISPLAECSAGKFPPMMSAEDWNKHKADKHLQIIILED